MLAAPLAVMVALTAAAAPQVTCRSGETEFRQGKVRVFSVFSRQRDTYYYCTRRIRTPRRFWRTDFASTEDFVRWRLAGRRLTFAIAISGAESFGWEIAYTDLGSRGRAHEALMDSGRDWGTDDPAAVKAVVADPDGAGLAYYRYDGDPEVPATIGFARIGPKGALHRGRARAYPSLRVVVDSLRVEGGVIHWTHRDGTAGSVPATG